jgi:hypothetical protein
MTEINYTHIVLDAIYEHSKFSSNFIKRECLKANEKHINNEEFYSSLLDAVKFFEIKINDIYASNLNRYFIGLNEDNLLPKENKKYYPKPELDKIGIPLFSYSNKYLGLTLHIEYLNNIKSIIHEASIGNKKNKEKNMSAPMIGLFCDIINYLGVIKQGELNRESYCDEVMKRFNINANPNSVRRYYKGFLDMKNSSKNLIALNELILPNLPEEIKNKVELFIKNQTKSFS